MIEGGRKRKRAVDEKAEGIRKERGRERCKEKPKREGRREGKLKWKMNEIGRD